MNYSRFLNLLLALALLLLAVRVVLVDRQSAASAVAGASSAATDTADAVMKNLLTRTSVRAYDESREIDDETVEQLLRAAMAAPTAGNKQPWEFVVLRDKALLRSLAERFRPMKMLAAAPLAIVVCADTTNTFPGEGHDFWVQDCSAASENLLLAAHALGLGAVWCGGYPSQERVAVLREGLGLPGHIVPLNVIPVGYPAEHPQPKDKWKPGKIHVDGW